MRLIICRERERKRERALKIVDELFECKVSTIKEVCNLRLIIWRERERERERERVENS